jgi:hypothetical protein
MTPDAPTRFDNGGAPASCRCPLCTDAPTPCRHGPTRQDGDPATGDVWCFACKPPRNLSAELRHRRNDAAQPAQQVQP